MNSTQIKVLISRSPITATLVIICLAMQVLETVAPSFDHYLVLVPILAKYEPWRLLTTTFLHAGWMHLLFNMLALISVGPVLEMVLGKAKYLTLYLLSALGGSLAVMLFLPNMRLLFDVNQAISSGWLTPTVGASGAIFGLFGAYYVIIKKVKADAKGITIMLAINLIYSFMAANISWQAHVGGLVTGILVMLIYSGINKYRYRHLRTV